MRIMHNFQKIKTFIKLQNFKNFNFYSKRIEKNFFNKNFLTKTFTKIFETKFIQQIEILLVF